MITHGAVKIVLSFVSVFAASLLVYVLIAALSKWENYDYTLAYQGLTAASDLDGRVQVGINFVNVGPTAINYKVENLRVVIGETTLSNPEYTEGSKIIPQNTLRLYRYPPFSSDSTKAYIGKDTSGSVEFAVSYGPYDGAFKRTLKMKLNVNFSIHPGKFAMADTIAEEQETRYRGD